MKRSAGLTLIELLVALAIIAIAFMALAQTQILNLRGTAQTQDLTNIKAVAVKKMEELAGKTLYTTEYACTTEPDGSCTYYYFDEYETKCTATSGESICSGTEGQTTWTVQTEPGILGEGLLRVTVTAHGKNGRSYTLSERVSCYDVYPAPSRDMPRACPVVPKML